MNVYLSVDDREVELDYDGRITCGDEELLTLKIRSCDTVDGGIVAILSDGKARDVTVSRPERNLVRVDPTCRLGWTVEVAPRHARETDGYRHKRSYVLNDRLITKTDVGRFFEIDSETGEIAHSWPGSAFRIGGRRIDLGHEVEHSLIADGVKILVTWNDTERATRRAKSYIHGFNDSGEKLWETTAGYHVHYTAVRDGVARFWKIGRKPKIEVDPQTGERP